MADQEFKIKFSTTGDPAGAHVVADSLDKAGTAAKNAGKEFDKTSDLATQLGKRGSSAKDVYEGLTATLNGGTSSVFGLAKAWHNLSEAMAANPLGAALAVALALAPALFSLIRGFSGTAEAAKDTAAKFTEVKSAAEQLDDVKLETLKKELDGIKQQAGLALELFNQLKALQDRAAKAEQTIEEAAITGDASLSPDEKKKRLFAVREKYQKFAQDQEDRDRAQKLGTAQSQANASGAVATSAENERDEAFARVWAINSERGERQQLITGIKARLSASQRKTPGAFISPEAARIRIEQQEMLKKQLEEAEARDAIATSPGAVAGEKAAQERLDAATARAKEARATAEQDAAAADALARLNELQERTLPGVRRKETNARRAEAGLPPLPDTAPDSTMSTRPVKGFISIDGRLVAPPPDTVRRNYPGTESVRTEFPGAAATGKAMGDHVGEVVNQVLSDLLPTFKQAVDESVKKNTEALQSQIKNYRN